MTPYFLIPGITCILEWGWNHFNPESLLDLSDTTDLKDKFNNPYPLYTNNILASKGNYDVIFGTATLGAGGTLAFPITGAVNSAAQANACVFEVWLAVGPAVPAAGAPTVGAKYSGIAVFAAGVATVTLNALDDTGAAIAAARNPLGFRFYVPRVGYF
jgi:hypothetical protein